MTVWEILFLDISTCWKSKNENVGKGESSTNPEDPPNKFLEILSRGSIPSKKPGMANLENLEYEINIYEKHELEIW